jgi:4,5-DOPA dioxygenase extradiol
MINYLHMPQLAHKLLPPTSKLPIIFIGHGSPFNISANIISNEWKRIGLAIPSSTCCIIVSAHNTSNDNFILSTSTNRHEVHDFYGFPDNLYKEFYRALGSTDISNHIQKQFPFLETEESETLDHGEWSVLKHLLPYGKTPILSLSVPLHLNYTDLIKQISPLRELRELGVLFIFSGNLVHNLNDIRIKGDTHYTEKFANACIEAAIHKDKNAIIALEGHPHKNFAHPLDDHLRPFIMWSALLDKNDHVTISNNLTEYSSIHMATLIAA